MMDTGMNEPFDIYQVVTWVVIMRITLMVN